MSQFTPIPKEVFERMPTVMSNHFAQGSPTGTAFDVRIQAFEGDDGNAAFAIEVYEDATTVTPSDRRQKPYVEAKQTTYFFDADGGFDGEPQVTAWRYH